MISELRTLTTVGIPEDAHVGSLSNGSYIVVWADRGTLKAGKISSDGTVIGGEFTLVEDANRVNIVRNDVSVTGLKEGGFAITWTEFRENSADERDVFVQVFNDAGTPISSKTIANSFRTENQTNPDIAALDDGGFLVVWQSERQDPEVPFPDNSSFSFSASTGIYARSFKSDGGFFSDEFRVNSTLVDQDEKPSVAGLPGGKVIAFWEKEEGVGDQDPLAGQIINSSGSKSGVEFFQFPDGVITTVLKRDLDGAVQVENSDVAASPKGGFAVVYAVSNSSSYIQIFDENGQALGARIAIGNQNTSLSQAVVTALDNGNYAIAWWESSANGNTAGAYTQVIGADGSAVTNRTLIAEGPLGGGTDIVDIGSIGNDYIVAFDNRKSSGASLDFVFVDDGGPTQPSSSLEALFSSQTDTAKALSAAYELLLGGVPNAAGYTFLINGAVSTNFGAGPGPVFNTENIYINLFNNLVQGNPAAKARFDAIATGTTLTEKITSIYQALVPPSKQTAEGLAFIARPDGIAFYQSVAAERGVAGTDGAAIIAMASLMQIAVNGDFGVGNAVNDLLKAVAASSAAIPASGSVLTAIETADGTAFDADDAAALARTVDPAPYSYLSEVDGGVNDLSGTTDIAFIGIGLIDA